VVRCGTAPTFVTATVTDMGVVSGVGAVQVTVLQLDAVLPGP
jgi:hypothetical protein